MITYGILKEIITIEGLYIIEKPLITAIKLIRAENPNANDTSQISDAALWSLAKIYLNAPGLFTPYLNDTTRATLENTVTLFSRFKKNDLLTEENICYIQDPTKRAAILKLDESEESDFIIKHIKDYTDWEHIYTWLKKLGQLTLANLKALEPHYTHFKNIPIKHMTTISHFEQQTIYNAELITIIIKNPMSTGVILEMLYNNNSNRNHALNIYVVDCIKNNKISDPQTISVLADNQSFLKNQSAEIQTFIWAHYNKLQQWIYAAKFLQNLKILSLDNLNKIETKIDAAADAFNQLATTNFPSAAQEIFEYILAHPEMADFLKKNNTQAHDIIFLLEKMPEAKDAIIKNTAHATSAREVIGILSKNDMLAEDDLVLSLIISLARELYHCVDILDTSSLMGFYPNIKISKETPAAIIELSNALKLLSGKANKAITQEMFNTVWNFSTGFAAASRLIIPEKNDSEYIVTNPMHAEGIAAALLCIQMNSHLQQYKEKILLYPEHAQQLMFALRNITNTTKIQPQERTAVIDYVISKPQCATTSAAGYISLRNQNMLHTEAFALMKADPKHISDIAKARQDIGKIELENEIKNLLKDSVAYEIKSETPPHHHNNIRIDYAKLTSALTSLENSDYASFKIGKIHAQNELQIPHYFHCARLYLNKIPPSSGWYLTAQQVLCELLYNQCALLGEDGREEECTMCKEEFDATVKILDDNEQPGEFLNTIRKNNEIFAVDDRSLLGSIADTKITDGKRSVAVQTMRLASPLYCWNLVPNNVKVSKETITNAAASTIKSSTLIPQ